MRFSRNPISGEIEVYSDDCEYLGKIHTMGDDLMNGGDEDDSDDEDDVKTHITDGLEDGGEGSGNHNHAGRPGQVGGSAPSGSSSSYSDEMSEKGYVGLSGAESDAFMEKHHNKALIGSRTGNTMSGGQSRRINSALRNGKMPSDPDDAKLVERLDVAIKRNQLPQDMTLFRGIGANALANTGLFSDWEEKHVKWSDYTLPNGKHDFDGWEKAETEAENENIQGLLSRAKKLIGKEITDDGFMQTSASSERNIFAFSDFNLQIHAPKGTNAYISNYKLESEIILGRGTTLKITDATVATVKLKNGNQKKVVQLIAEVVPSSKTHRTTDSWTFADYEVEDEETDGEN